MKSIFSIFLFAMVTFSTVCGVVYFCKGRPAETALFAAAAAVFFAAGRQILRDLEGGA